MRNVVLAFSCLRTPGQALGISTLIHSLGILLLGISENVLLAPTQSSTTVFLITGLMCEQAVRAARPTRARGEDIVAQAAAPGLRSGHAAGPAAWRALRVKRENPFAAGTARHRRVAGHRRSRNIGIDP